MAKASKREADKKRKRSRVASLFCALPQSKRCRGAEGGTCLTGSAERGHRGAVRERAAHGNDGVVCAGSRSRVGTEKSPSKSARAFGAEGGT